MLFVYNQGGVPYFETNPNEMKSQVLIRVEPFKAPLRGKVAGRNKPSLKPKVCAVTSANMLKPTAAEEHNQIDLTLPSGPVSDFFLVGFQCRPFGLQLEAERGCLSG